MIHSLLTTRGFFMMILAGALFLSPAISALSQPGRHGPRPGPIAPGRVEMRGGPHPGEPGFRPQHRPHYRPHKRPPYRYHNRPYTRHRYGYPYPAPVPFGYPIFPGRVFRDLPADIFRLHVAGALFFYHLGTYYQHTPNGYVVVEAPIGARVTILPEGCPTIVSRGHRYFVCDDVYYEQVADGYVVVARPADYEEQRAQEVESVQVNVDVLEVYSGPGQQYKIINELSRGDVVEVGGSDQGWYYVMLPDHSPGWIMSQHTVP